jgi:uncharacterized membrane protein YdjX (TVP38/TMEM64 family)
MIKLDRQSILQLILIVVVISAGSYLLYALGLVDLLTDRQRLLVFIREHRNTAVLTFIGLQVLQVLAAPVPGEMTGFVGGMFFGMGWGIVYSTIGLTIGSWLAFMIARLLGRHIVEVVVNPETLNRYDYVMKHKGLVLAFLMFLIPGFPKDILCYVLGLGHMGQRDFLLISTTGRLLGTTLLTVGGSFVRDHRYGAFFTVAGIGIAAILVVMIYRDRIEGWFRAMRLRHHRQARTERRTKRRKRAGERPNEP